MPDALHTSPAFAGASCLRSAAAHLNPHYLRALPLVLFTKSLSISGLQFEDK
jgi:hypothetical protein